MCSVEGDILVSNIVRREEGSGEYLIPSLQQLKKKVERVFGVQPSVVLSEAREGVSEDTCGDACGKRQFRAYGEALLKQHGVEVCAKGDIEEEKGEKEEKEAEKEEMETEKEEKGEVETEGKKETEGKGEMEEMETEKENEKTEQPLTCFPLHTLPYRFLRHPPPHAASLPLAPTPPLSARLSFWRDLLPAPAHTPFNRYHYRRSPPRLRPPAPTPSPPAPSLEESFVSSTLTPSQPEMILVRLRSLLHTSRLSASSASSCSATHPRGRSPIPQRTRFWLCATPSPPRVAHPFYSLTETRTTTTERPSTTV